MHLYFINTKPICDLWCYCICLCCIRVISWFVSQNYMNKQYLTMKAAEMSGLWNFSVRIQSWSVIIESDPALIRKIYKNYQSDQVLIRNCKNVFFILPHVFILSLPHPDLCGSEQPIHRERPVATQHPLCNCVDHLAAPSHIYSTPRVQTGQ